MAEEAPAPAPTKVTKKRSAPLRKKDGLSIPNLITSAVAESKDRKGLSLTAIKRVLKEKGIDVPKLNKRINIIVVRMVTKGILQQTSGLGATGSFKLAKDNTKKLQTAGKKSPSKPRKPAAKKPAAKKPVAKKPAAKKPAAKKAAKKPAAKKSTPKKSPKKIKVKKMIKVSPKKPTKKPAAKKVTKKTTPKKVVKRTAVQKTAAKKSAAKKGKK